MSTLAIARAAKYGMYGIIAYDVAGYAYVLNQQFRRDDPRTMTTLTRIREKKQIDLRYWHPKKKGGW